MNGPDSSEQPNLNTGAPWSSWDDQDIRLGLDHDSSIEEIANFLCRTPSEVRQRIGEIAQDIQISAGYPYIRPQTLPQGTVTAAGRGHILRATARRR